MEHKPIIETVINTTALALTSFGVVQITTLGFIWQGYLAIGVGLILEWVKYYGRHKGIW